MKWFQGSIPEAIQSSKANKSVFIVYVYGEDELSQQMSKTWEDDQVTEICQANKVVAVRIAGNSEACGFFSQIYPVIVVPSSFFIGEGGVPLEVIGGYSEPSEFMKKIERVLQDHSRQLQNAVGDGTQVALSESGASNSKASAETKEELASSSDSQDLSDKVEKAKRLIEEKRKEKLQQEQEKARQAEKERRQLGQELQQLRENQKEQELKELQEQLKKEKQEERKAKERVREQIAKDRSIEEVLSSYPVRERVKTKRHELTIKEKIELLKVSEGKSLRQLANMFGIGKSQVCGLLKRKDEILGLIGTVMMDSNRKRRSFGNRDTAEINTLTLEWYQRARLANLTVSGPMLQQKAKEFAKILGKEDFKASNGWLDSFKRRHNIMSTKACSESLNSSVSSTSQDEDPVVYPETGDDQDSNEPETNEFSFLPNLYGTNYHNVTEGEGEANASGASTSTLSQPVFPQPESDQSTDGAKIYAQALLKTAECILNQHFQMEVKKEPIDPDEETSDDSSGSNEASVEQFSTQTTELSVCNFSMHESDSANQNLFQSLRPSTSSDSRTKASKNIYLPPLMRPSSFDSDKKGNTQELNDNDSDNNSEEGVASGLSANPFVALSGNDRFVYNPEAFSQSVCRDSEDDEINSDSEPNRIDGFELRRSLKRKADDLTPKERESIVSGCHSYEYSTNQLDTLAEVSSKRPKLSYDSITEQNTELNSQLGNTDESEEKNSSDDNVSSLPGISFEKLKKDLPRFFYKYAAKDVYVLVSTELMTHALPDKTLVGTKVKRLRVTFLCNLEGRCFKPVVTCTRDDFSLHQAMKNRPQDIFPVHLSFGGATAESSLYVNEVVDEADKILKDHGQHVFLFLEESFGKCIHQKPQNIDIVLCSESQTSVHSVVKWITYNFKLVYRKKLLRALLTHGCISCTNSAAELCEKVSMSDVSLWIREACENLNLGNLSLDKAVFLCKSLKEDSEFNTLLTMISKFLCFSQPMSVEEYVGLEGPDITSALSETEPDFAVVHKELTQIQSIVGQGINSQKEAYRAVQELKMFCAKQNLLDVLQNLESAEESLQKHIISGILS